MPITSQRVTMTPDKAQKLLSKNIKNRNVAARKVAELSHAMESGNWLFDGAPIRVAQDGTLLDGQHRLLACVRTGLSFDTLLVTGLDPASQVVMDTGTKRTFGHNLAMREEKDANLLAAVVSMHYRWMNGQRAGMLASTGAGLYEAQTIDLMQYFLSAPETFRAAVDATRSARRVYSGRILPTCYLLFAELDVEDADFFMEKLGSGADLGSRDPILVLRQRLLTIRSQPGTASVAQVMGLVIKAWNLYRAGAETDKLSYKPGGANRERFPEPK